VFDGMSIGKALSGDAGRGHGFMLRRQTSTGDQQRLAAFGDRAFVGDFVLIANEPL
jgi:hypothetical protein